MAKLTIKLAPANGAGWPGKAAAVTDTQVPKPAPPKLSLQLSQSSRPVFGLQGGKAVQLAPRPGRISGPVPGGQGTGLTALTFDFQRVSARSLVAPGGGGVANWAKPTSAAMLPWLADNAGMVSGREFLKLAIDEVLSTMPGKKKTADEANGGAVRTKENDGDDVAPEVSADAKPTAPEPALEKTFEAVAAEMRQDLLTSDALSEANLPPAAQALAEPMQKIDSDAMMEELKNDKPGNKLVILICSTPGTGKTTLVHKLVKKLRDEEGEGGVNLAGFYTEEVRDQANRRIGFDTIRLGGGPKGLPKTAAFARIGEAQPKVGKYTIDVPVFESMVLPSLEPPQPFLLPENPRLYTAPTGAEEAVTLVEVIEVGASNDTEASPPLCVIIFPRDGEQATVESSALRLVPAGWFPKALRNKPGEAPLPRLTVCDEVGKMALLSVKFTPTFQAAMNFAPNNGGSSVVLATSMLPPKGQRDMELIEEVRRRSDVYQVRLTRGNRDSLVDQVYAKLREGLGLGPPGTGIAKSASLDDDEMSKEEKKTLEQYGKDRVGFMARQERKDRLAAREAEEGKQRQDLLAKGQPESPKSKEEEEKKKKKKEKKEKKGLTSEEAAAAIAERKRKREAYRSGAKPEEVAQVAAGSGSTAVPSEAKRPKLGPDSAASPTPSPSPSRAASQALPAPSPSPSPSPPPLRPSPSPQKEELPQLQEEKQGPAPTAAARASTPEPKGPLAPKGMSASAKAAAAAAAAALAKAEAAAKAARERAAAAAAKAKAAGVSLISLSARSAASKPAARAPGRPPPTRPAAPKPLFQSGKAVAPVRVPLTGIRHAAKPPAAPARPAKAKAVDRNPMVIDD